MARVKILLTPYKAVKIENGKDAIQKWLSETSDVEQDVNFFAPIWQPGIDVLADRFSERLTTGTTLLSKFKNSTYDAVRTLGLYHGGGEPSLCVEIDLQDLKYAFDLLRVAAFFGRRFNQASVHVLFSLRETDVRNAWNTDVILQALAKRAVKKTVCLTSLRISLDRRVILKAANENNLPGLTTHLFGTQTFVYSYEHTKTAEQKNLRKFHRIADTLCKKSEKAVRKIARDRLLLTEPAPRANKITSWDALLFAVGGGDECTSTYSDWLGGQDEGGRVDHVCDF